MKTRLIALGSMAVIALGTLAALEAPLGITARIYRWAPIFGG